MSASNPWCLAGAAPRDLPSPEGPSRVVGSGGLQQFLEPPVLFGPAACGLSADLGSSRAHLGPVVLQGVVLRIAGEGCWVDAGFLVPCLTHLLAFPAQLLILVSSAGGLRQFRQPELDQLYTAFMPEVSPGTDGAFIQVLPQKLVLRPALPDPCRAAKIADLFSGLAGMSVGANTHGFATVFSA
ncbi:unnamed protein product, partial [Polarella glacialis]